MPHKNLTHFERFCEYTKTLYELTQQPEAELAYFLHLKLMVEELTNLIALMERPK